MHHAILRLSTARLLSLPAILVATALAARAAAQESRPAPEDPGRAEAARPGDDDRYLAGYAAAVLERELRIPKALVRVSSGVVTVTTADLSTHDAEKVKELIASIPGVVRVDVAKADPGAIGDQSRQPRTQGQGPGASQGSQVLAEAEPNSFLQRTDLLFQPLHADPRWPHFSAAYHNYRGNDGLEHVAATTFGESLSLYRHAEADAPVQWELGIQAGVFSIFDLDSESFDLVNADYFVGPVATLRRDRFSLLARLYHQSSHLGDEFLLRTRASRINLSYEVIDLVASFELTDALRVYAGGGYVLHSDTPLDSWSAQGGVEWFGGTFGESGVRPLVVCDVQAREENDWHTDVSVRTGIQLESSTTAGTRMQVVLEHYRGHSPNGQFFEQDIEYYGLGVHFFF